MQAIEPFWIAAYATMTKEVTLVRHSGHRAGIQTIEVPKLPPAPKRHANLAQCYSTFTLAALITFAHLTRSTLMYAPNAAGVISAGSAPWLTIKFFISGVSMILAISPYRRRMIGSGVFPGAI